MPRYAPLPNINLDPRSEAEIVTAAARRVFEASGGTINDFSAGSPIMALLEGQAFAQAEFLQFANQFPESVLVEWIGPFLGAQRRTGSGSSVLLGFEIEPRNQDFVVFEGFEAATDPEITNGESVGFVTIEPLNIPAGESVGFVTAVSLFLGVDTNVPPNSITRPVTSLAGIKRVFNPEVALGGQDVELLSEVKERFFTLIRRRNPVSREDWIDFFTDLIGVGTSVNVVPNRSEREFSNYGQSNPNVSFFLLNPDGTPLTQTQIGILNNAIRWSLPVEFRGKIHSMELNPLDIFLEVGYNPDNNYSKDLKKVSKSVRDNLFRILSPNAVFPTTYSLTPNDIGNALSTSFPLTFGNAFDPSIFQLKTYSTPYKLSTSDAQLYSPGTILLSGDLVVDNTGIEETFYEVLENFTPVVGDKFYHCNVGDLELKLIKNLEPVFYVTGDVISDSNSLFVVLSSFNYDGKKTIAQLISQGFISSEKSFSPFSVGANFVATDDNNFLNPEIILFDPDPKVYQPVLPENFELEKRPGYPVWVVKKNFTRVQDTTNLGTAQGRNLVSTLSVEVKEIKNLQRYLVGDFVKTVYPETIPEPNNCYLDLNQGVLELFGRVEKEFTFRVDPQENFKEIYDSLISTGYIKPVKVVPYVSNMGESLFALKPFKYGTRFNAGEYVRYRPEGGFNASDLEKCVRQVEGCSLVTPSCRRLLEANLPLPSYFFVLRDFTPNTQSIEKLISQGFITPVPKSIFFPTYTAVCPDNKEPVTNDCITNILLNQGLLNRSEQIVKGQTTELLNREGERVGIYVWDGLRWVEKINGFLTFRDLFRFSPKDVTTLKNNSLLYNYEATSFVTPITNFDVYFHAGVFVPTVNSETVKFINPNYQLENLCQLGNKFYRTILPVTPDSETTPESLELSGNFLKLVVEFEGTDEIKNRLDLQSSARKLGVVQVTLKEKFNKGGGSQKFVWGESTTFLNPPGFNKNLSPSEYEGGTLTL